MTDPALRDRIWQRDRGRCRWPRCGRPAHSVAHAHSKGMGGTRGDDEANLLLLCWDHALISDGEYGSGGAAQYREAHLRLLGHLDTPQHRIAYERAEAIQNVIATLYSEG